MMSPEYMVPQADATPLTTVRHGGIELPLYDSDDVAWNSNTLKRAAQMGRANIVRSVRINPNLRFILSELLEIADQTFNKVAEDASATVVPHTWGFSVAPDYVHQIDTTRYLSHFNPGLPGNTSLVAKVAIIPHTQNVYDRFRQLNTALHDHRLNSTNATHVWYDADLRNFVQDEQGNLILTDIEPFIMQFKDRREPAGTIKHLTDSTL